MWGPYIFLMCIAVVASMSLLHKFAAPNVTIATLCITGYAWLVSLSMIALVPIDVYATISKPNYGTKPLTVLWKVSYWSTQLLTWVIVPIMKGYVSAGDYTLLGRIRTALRRLWRFYTLILVLALIGIIVAWSYGKLSVSTLPQLIITLSNTFGLVVIIGLLGYGLVEVPRLLWRRSFPETRVKWHMHRIGRSAERLTQAAESLKKTLAVVIMTRQQVPPANASLREMAEALVRHADKASPIPLSTLASVKVEDVEELDEKDLDYATSEAGLARLKERLMVNIANFVGFKGEYLGNVKRGLELELICKSRQHGVYTPPDTYLPNQKPPLRRATWYYLCRFRPWFQRAGAAAAAAVSLTLVWSEVTIGSGTSPDLSPFSLLVRNKDIRSSIWLEQIVAIALPLGYVAACCYSSLFKVGGTTFYHVVPGATWAPSLLFNSSLLARYAAPLAFNFLHVIRMDTGFHGRLPVFVKLYGLQDVPLLGSGFNTWFPTVLIVYILMLVSNTCAACAELFVPPQFRFDADRADDVHTVAGARYLHAEQEALAKGGRIGQGIELPGMVTLPSSSASAAASKGQSSVELSEQHQRLFGSGMGISSSSSAPEHSDNIDSNNTNNKGKGRSRGDAVDEIFERVEIGGLSGGGPSVRGAWAQSSPPSP